MNTTNYSTPNITVLAQEEAAVLLWRIIPPVLLVVGTLSSILCILVFSRKEMREFRMSDYLICLSVADLLVLYFGPLVQWVLYMFDTDIRDMHPALCKIDTWMVYFSLDLSAWILVCVTIERAVAVWMPFKVKIIWTKKVVRTNIICVIVLLLVINGHFLVGLGNNDTVSCGSLNENYTYFLDYVFPWIDLCVFCLGPFLFQMVGNTAIIVGLCRHFREIKTLKILREDQAKQRKFELLSMTRMLLSLNLIFLVCTLPVSVFFIYKPRWDLDTSPEADAQRLLTYACVNLVMYFNNSTNLITCSVGGSKFRKELLKLICRWKVKRPKRLTAYGETKKKRSNEVEIEFCTHL